MTNEPLNEIEEKEFKSRWRFRMRAIAAVLVLSFFYEQVLWAAGDPSSLKKDKRKELTEQMGYLPTYLQKRNQQALQNIREKEDLNNLANLLEDQFTARMRTKKAPFEDDDRRRGGGDGGQLTYTLGDNNTTINIYEYKDDKLYRIKTYEADGVISDLIASAQEIETKDKDKKEKLMGGFTAVSPGRFSPERQISETYFEGEGENRHAAYILTGFVAGKATQITFNEYDGGGALTKTVTYDIEDSDQDFRGAASQSSLNENQKIAESFFTGAKGKEKIESTFSDFDQSNDPQTYTRYTYEGDVLKDSKSYDMEDIKQFFTKDGKLDLSNEELRDILLSDKLDGMSSKSLLELLEGKGLLKNGDADSILANEDIKEALLRDLSAKEFLNLLYSKGFLEEDVETTLKEIDFDSAFDKLSAEEKARLLEGKEKSDVKLEDVLNLLSAEEILGFLGSDKTLADILAAVSNEDILSTVDVKRLLQLLDKNSLLQGSVEDAMSLLKDEFLKGLSEEDLMKLVASDRRLKKVSRIITRTKMEKE